MSRTIRLHAGCVLLLCLAPALSRAATVSLSIDCVDNSQTLNDAGHITCQSTNPVHGLYAWAEALAGPSGVGVDIANYGSASATYTADFQVTITNGSGTGWYAPCLSTYADPGAGAMAQFGTLFAVTPCYTFSSQDLPFTYGVPQTEQLSLSAWAPYGLRSQMASAEIAGFVVYDMSGNRQSSATVDMVELVPEPCLLVPFGIMLALGWASITSRSHDSDRWRLFQPYRNPSGPTRPGAGA